MGLRQWSNVVDADTAVQVRSVSKKFKLHHELGQLRHVTWLERLRQRDRFEDLWVLKNVSFSVSRGTTLGIIGDNGSGKSTLLKLITGVLEPTSGSIKVTGRISALIELGTGFHPDLTGTENIFLNGSLLGLTHREIEERIPDIIAFSELERFIDTPLKHYSSGMQVRLGFAVATTVQPDILITDEVLAVGDEGFQRKCLTQMEGYRHHGGTILFVSHVLTMVREFCDRVIWLSDGVIRADGLAADVVDAYYREVNRKTIMPAHVPQTNAAAAHQALVPPAEPTDDSACSRREATSHGSPRNGHRQLTAFATSMLPTMQDTPLRWGDGLVRLTAVRLVNADGKPTTQFQSGAALRINIHFRSVGDTPDGVIFGIAIYNGAGVLCYGTNTAIDNFSVQELGTEGMISLLFDEMALMNGDYVLNVAAHRLDGHAHDYWRQCANFKVKTTIADQGVFRPQHRWLMSYAEPTLR